MWQYPQFDPIALQLGPIAIHWYGVAYLMGFVAARALARRHIRAGHAPLSLPAFDDLLFYALLGVIVGGRLGYMLFYNWSQWLAHPWQVFAIWHGGMSFHGGLIGVALALIGWSRRRGHALLPISDFVVPLVPIGLAFGRLANFINGELWGRPTDVAWGMVFPRADHLVRHPSQLYECLLEGVGLFVLMQWFSRKPWAAGAVSGLFLIAYGVVRFVLEFWRAPDVQLGFVLLGHFTMGQCLSLPMVLVGGYLCFKSK